MNSNQQTTKTKEPPPPLPAYVQSNPRKPLSNRLVKQWDKKLTRNESQRQMDRELSADHYLNANDDDDDDNDDGNGNDNGDENHHSNHGHLNFPSHLPSFCRVSEVRGPDIQRITWRLLRNSRWKYRRDRIQRYEQFLSSNTRGEDETKPLGDLVDLRREVNRVTCDMENFYEFAFNAKMAHASLTHFQLRHLLSCCEVGGSGSASGSGSAQRVLYIQNRASVHSFDPISRTSRHEFDFVPRNVPQATNGLGDQDRETTAAAATATAWSPPVITTMSTMRDLVAIGGFRGEIMIQSMRGATPRLIFDEKVTRELNSITNHIQIAPSDTFGSGSGGSNSNSNSEYTTTPAQVIIASNDKKVRFLSTEQHGCSLAKEFNFPFCVNNACIPVDRSGKNAKLLAVLGDHHTVHIVDHVTSSPSSAPIRVLTGHLDYCFAASWHPTNDNILVTGSQDKTARVWDMRMTRQCVQLLCGCMGPVRNITFSNDGQFVAFSEPADIVHVYRTDSQFPVATEQMIDLFGEICGISFSNSDALGRNSLFVGVFDRAYNSILQFDRRCGGSSFLLDRTLF